MEVPVRVWEVEAGVAYGVRLDVGEPVEFGVSASDSIVSVGRDVGTHSRPTFVDVSRLRPWLPTWGDEPSGAA
jgi:hypothetical protein